MPTITRVRRDSAFSMLDDYRHFRRTYRAARSSRNDDDVNHLNAWLAYEPVLGSTIGPEFNEAWRFGYEIEFVTDDSIRQISRHLHNSGVTESPGISDYHASSSRGYRNWVLERDGTVSGELVSPILTDNRESWLSLQKAVNALSETGCDVENRSVGGHLHMTSDGLGSDIAAWERLTKIARTFEDVYFRIGSNSKRKFGRGALRVHRTTGRTTHSYSPPLPSTENLLLNTGYMRPWLNTSSVNRLGNGHIEFRVFDGSLDMGVLQARARIAAATLRAAKNPETDDILDSLEVMPIGAHYRAEWWKNEDGTRKTSLSGEDWKRDTLHIRALSDILFDNNNEREMLVTLFALNDWSWRQNRSRR